MTARCSSLDAYFKSKVENLNKKNSKISEIHKKYDKKIIFACDIFHEVQPIYLEAKHAYETLISITGREFQKDDLLLSEKYAQKIRPHKKSKEENIEKSLQARRKKNGNSYR